MSYDLRPPPPPSVTGRSDDTAASSSNTAGIVAGVVVSLLFVILVAVLLYRRRHSERSNRKAIEAQLLQALQNINGKLQLGPTVWLSVGVVVIVGVGVDGSWQHST
jgi:TRAP-type C4-dicarboxylate transport system permease large subunit